MRLACAWASDGSRARAASCAAIAPVTSPASASATPRRRLRRAIVSKRGHGVAQRILERRPSRPNCAVLRERALRVLGPSRARGTRARGRSRRRQTRERARSRAGSAGWPGRGGPSARRCGRARARQRAPRARRRSATRRDAGSRRWSPASNRVSASADAGGQIVRRQARRLPEPRRGVVEPCETPKHEPSRYMTVQRRAARAPGSAHKPGGHHPIVPRPAASSASAATAPASDGRDVAALCTREMASRAAGG